MNEEIAAEKTLYKWVEWPIWILSLNRRVHVQAKSIRMRGEQTKETERITQEIHQLKLRGEKNYFTNFFK